MIVTHIFQIVKKDSRWYYGFYCVTGQLFSLYCIENNKKHVECIPIPNTAINNDEFYIEEINNDV